MIFLKNYQLSILLS